MLILLLASLPLKTVFANIDFEQHSMPCHSIDNNSSQIIPVDCDNCSESNNCNSCSHFSVAAILQSSYLSAHSFTVLTFNRLAQDSFKFTTSTLLRPPQNIKPTI